MKVIKSIDTNTYSRKFGQLPFLGPLQDGPGLANNAGNYNLGELFNTLKVLRSLLWIFSLCITLEQRSVLPLRMKLQRRSHVHISYIHYDQCCQQSTDLIGSLISPSVSPIN